jgi:bacterial leucyl aminopeptidase
MIHWDKVQPMLMELSEHNLNQTLVKLTSFFNRHWKTRWGVEASRWLHRYISDIIFYNPIHVAANVTSRLFKHPWPQASIIVTIPGQTNTTIVLGAHMDTRQRGKYKKYKNGNVKYVEDPEDLPDLKGSVRILSNTRHIGADDNGSGVVALIEILRVLLLDPDIAAGKHVNTIEFHWYAAEEVHQQGSSAIFRDYWQKNRDIKAMLNHDMLGFVHGGSTPHIGLNSEGDGTGLSQFVIKCAEAVSSLTNHQTKQPAWVADLILILVLFPHHQRDILPLRVL